MKNPKFNSNQCVKIENKEQFNEIYHVFRSSKNGFPLHEWLKNSGGYPKFPIYLEHATSVLGSSIGYTTEPKNTWTKNKYQVISLEEACEDDFSPIDKDFICCDKCDLPDACSDFGCAIKTGVRKENDW